MEVDEAIVDLSLGWDNLDKNASVGDNTNFFCVTIAVVVSDVFRQKIERQSTAILANNVEVKSWESF